MSVPSLLDSSLAPAGRHAIHAYLPATEPYEVWEGLDRRSDEYAKLQARRVEPLYAAIEKFIPDLRSRVELELIGSPLTHERLLRRSRGTYGPELRAGVRDFPGATTPIDGLLCSATARGRALACPRSRDRASPRHTRSSAPTLSWSCSMRCGSVACWASETIRSPFGSLVQKSYL